MDDENSHIAFRIILNYLIDFGECSDEEIHRNCNVQDLKLLKDSKLVLVLDKTWIIGNRLLGLFPVKDVEQLLFGICSLHPAYRRYLIVLIAGEITRHGLEGAMDLTEDWVVKGLSGVVGELNQILNELERDYLETSVKKASIGNIVRSNNNLLEDIQHEASLDFNAWNKELFGVSGNNEAVFQALLSRQFFQQERSVINDDVKVSPSKIVDINTDLSNPNSRLVFFPPLDIQEFENGELNIQPSPTWRKRQYVYSSIPLWGLNEDISVTTEDLQNAFCQHPIPWILIQLGNVQYTQSVMGESDKPILMKALRDPEGSITDIKISTGQERTILFSTILPELLNSLGFRLVMPFGSIEEKFLSGLLNTLCKAHIFYLDSNNQFILDDGFVNRLNERSQRKGLVKYPKPFRNLLFESIKNRL